MQSYTSIPISNPPPRPAIPIAEGADQAVMQNKTNLQKFYHMLQEILNIRVKKHQQILYLKLCSKPVQCNQTILVYPIGKNLIKTLI